MKILSPIIIANQLCPSNQHSIRGKAPISMNSSRDVPVLVEGVSEREKQTFIFQWKQRIRGFQEQSKKLKGRLAG